MTLYNSINQGCVGFDYKTVIYGKLRPIFKRYPFALAITSATPTKTPTASNTATAVTILTRVILIAAALTTAIFIAAGFIRTA